MRSLTEGAEDALNSSSVTIVQLLHVNFSPTPITLNMSTWDLEWDGVVYKGAYGLGTISAIEDKPGEAQGITFELFGDAAHIALALDDSDQVQGTACVIRTAILDSETSEILDAPVEWKGTLDTMSITEDGEKCTVIVTAESEVVNLLKGNPFFYTDEDQRTININDGCFSYIVSQMDKPVIWPTRAFFYK